MSFERVLAALKSGPAPQVRPDSVLFSSPWKRAADGWCIATRAYARAMHEAGLQVGLRDWLTRVAEPEASQEVEYILKTALSAWALHVFSCTVGGAAEMLVLDRLLLNPEPQAFYCVFERRHIEQELVDKLNRLRGVWVQCRMNYAVLKAAGVTNVALHRYPYFDDDPHLALPLPSRKPRRFYYIGRFEPRKAPDNIIRAFFRAFRPGEAELVIKTSPIPHKDEYPSPHEVVLSELALPEVRERGWTADNWGSSITIVQQRFTADQMVRLHAEGDIYVSASRGEGLDLPAWAAKLSGRRIVTTASGGPQDFLDPEVDLVVPVTKLVEADPCYQWGAGATYIDYSLDDLVAAMRRARWDPKQGTRDWPGRSFHHSRKVGQKLKEWVRECSR